MYNVSKEFEAVKLKKPPQDFPTCVGINRADPSQDQRLVRNSAALLPVACFWANLRLNDLFVGLCGFYVKIH